MKWIPIDKAKPNFETIYLIHTGDSYTVGELVESKSTVSGVVHYFHAQIDDEHVKADKIAIIGPINATKE